MPRGPRGGGRRGRERAVGAGLQQPRHHQHDVPGDEERGRVERGGAARVYPGDWVLPHAGAGGGADAGAVVGVRGEVVPVGDETGGF